MQKKSFQLSLMFLKDIENAVHVNTGSLYTEEGDDQYDFDDEFMDEWNELLQDDELFDMIIEKYVIVKTAVFTY